MPTVPELIAHRGAPRERRENTIPSFAAALAHGADAIELDVHVTRDHVPVVHHDATLGPSANPDAGTRIDALDAFALTRIEIAAGVTIPTLRHVCELVGDRATLYVEIKGALHAADLAAVHAAIASDRSVRPRRVAIHSFDHDLVRRSAMIAPDIATGILRERETDLPVAALRAAHARDLWQHWADIDADLVASVHAAGSRVIAWTVNDADVARRLAACGVDGLCTDDVPHVRAALQGSGDPTRRSTQDLRAP